MTPMCWHVQMFGGLQASRNEHVLCHFRTRKTGLLLAYLALHRTRAHSRDHLAQLFWPDENREAADANLRVALSALRRQLEPAGSAPGSVLQADRSLVGLNPDLCTTDVAAFEAARSAAAQAETGKERIALFKSVIACYHGPLLAGYQAEWIEGLRQRLADAYLGTLRHLVRHLAQDGNFGDALEYAQRLVDADPSREESHRTVMRLYVALGRPAAARQHYQEMTALLGRSPSPQTQEIAALLATDRSPDGPILGALSPSSNLPASSPAAVPPSLPASGSLPATWNRFFGRRTEMEQIQAMLRSDETRLVTLIGPGGSGKSRLALEVAKRLQEEFAGAVWTIPLTEVTDPHRIPDAIRYVMRLPQTGQSEPLAQILAALSHRPALFLLDNFEQLAEKGAAVVQALLEGAPALTCLVTSRQRLDIGGEQVIDLLPLPTPTRAESVSGMQDYPSVQLFVDRAHAVHASFALTEQNAEEVAALCRRLEGLPLAIELAAAWAQTLTLRQMLARLERRFDLLVSRRKDLPVRHRTLWAALEGSLRALSPRQRAFFTRLSVFRGGWTLEAAEEVCAERNALDYLTQLKEHSLVLAEEQGGEMRFRLLETLREFAGAQLPAAEREQCTRLHAEYYLRLAETAQEPERQGEEVTACFDRLEREQDNLRAALDWCQAQAGCAERGLQAAVALYPFWWTRGYLREGRERLVAFLAQSEPLGATALRALGFHYAGEFARGEGDLAATQFFHERSLWLARALDDRTAIARALFGLGRSAYHYGKMPMAQDFYEQSLTLWREIGDTREIIQTLNGLGNTAICREDYPSVHAYWQESLDLSRRIQDAQAISNGLASLGYVAFCQNDSAAARALCEESLEVARRSGDRQTIVARLWNLGNLARAQGEYARARWLLEESRDLAVSIGDRQIWASILYSLAIVACEQEDYASARTLLEERLRLFREMGVQWDIGQAVEVYARLALAARKPERAARLFGATEAWQQIMDTGIWWPENRALHERTVAAVRAAMPKEAFSAAWQEGRSLSLEQAISEALEN